MNASSDIPAARPEGGSAGSNQETPAGSSLPLIFSPRQLWSATGLILALWTLAVAASMFWNEHLLHSAMLDAARNDARNNFNKDVLYRKWATMHGAVYVPVTAYSPPNPYLANVPERDLVTPSGRRLTLMNPASMTRQVHELETKEFGTHGHITSLKPLRPANAPDAWETNALRAFERGRTEVSSSESYNGQPYLRLMKPLMVEEACLKCHAAQGYKAGQIRGGISIAVPLGPYLALEQTRISHIVGTHAGLWALGLLGIFLGARQMRHRLDQQARAEKKLWESEEKFRTVADWTYDMETWRGPDGRFVYVSPSAERVTGYRAGEFLADPELTLKITHPDDQARVREHHQKVSQPGNEVCSMDFRILTRSGEERWINHHCQPVYDANGRWLGQRSGNRDITERRRAEKALRESETRLRRLSDNLPGGMTYQLDFGVDGRMRQFTFIGAGVEKLHEITAEAVMRDAQLLYGQIIEEDRQHVAAKEIEAEATMTPFTAEARFRLPSGVERWGLITSSPRRTADGHLIWDGIEIDITERKQMEEKLRQLSTAVEQSPASIVITNRAGDIEYVNSKFVELTGYTLAEVLGKNPRVLKSGEKSPEAYRELWETITAGKEWRGEFHNKKKNGEFYWEFASISPIRDPAGRVTHYVAVKEDITGRKRTEAERDRLIHELQNALANVKLLSGLLPICAGCKKIRDDTGYWTQVESYIQNHSEAKFSHGMCPDCLRKWYPDLVAGGLGSASGEKS